MLHIFRAGRQVATDGRAIEFTEAHLQAAASAYDPAKHEAPIVVGHPATDAPAYGWIEKLEASGQDLTAKPHQVNAEFAELVKQGAFKKISASFYLPDCPRNPVPGTYYLRHVGFLGAQAPAVKGLRSPEFAGETEGFIEFSDWGHETNASLWRRLRDWFIGEHSLEKADQVIPDWMINSIHEAADRDVKAVSAYADPPTNTGEHMDKEKEALQQENARLQAELKTAQEAKAATDLRFAEEEKTRKEAASAAAHAAHVQFAEQLVTAGKLLPVQQASVVTLLDVLAGHPGVEFGEGEAKGKLAARSISRVSTSLPGRLASKR